MRLTITRDTTINLILALAFAAASVVYLATFGVHHGLNTVAAITVAATAFVLSNNLWK